MTGRDDGRQWPTLSTGDPRAVGNGDVFDGYPYYGGQPSPGQKARDRRSATFRKFRDDRAPNSGWLASPHGRTVYASCCTGGRVVYMHRMIMRPRQGYVVDHIDGNGLNNRRCNLRVCTRRQNQANQGPRGGSSRFVGVYRHKNKWEAGIRCRGKRYYLGLFDDEVEAAKARDRKAYELHGAHAYLNFPEDYRR